MTTDQKVIGSTPIGCAISVKAFALTLATIKPKLIAEAVEEFSAVRKPKAQTAGGNAATLAFVTLDAIMSKEITQAAPRVESCLSRRHKGGIPSIRRPGGRRILFDWDSVKASSAVGRPLGRADRTLLPEI